MSPPAGCRIATGSRNEFLTDVAPEETLVLKGEEERGEFKIVKNSRAVHQESVMGWGWGGDSGLLCVLARPRPGGVPFLPV